MKRKTIAFLLAPIPAIVVFLIILVYVLISPGQLIDGKPDDAPYRAATLLIPMIPLFFYPILLCIFALRLFIAERMKESCLRNYFYADILMSVFISALLAYIIYRPQFSESFLLTWVIILPIWIVLSISMTLTWKMINGKVKNEANDLENKLNGK